MTAAILTCVVLALVAVMVAVVLPTHLAHREERPNNWAGDAWAAEREHAQGADALIEQPVVGGLGRRYTA